MSAAQSGKYGPRFGGVDFHAPPERISMSWTTQRARLAGTLRQNPDADVTELRRDLKVARLEDHIRRLVDEAPPLTAAQRERLAALLSPVERAVAA